MSVGGAEDNVVTTSRIQVVQQDYIEERQSFPTEVATRSAQQTIAPRAVVGRLYAPLQFRSSVTEGPIDVPTGASFTATVTSRSLQQETIQQWVGRQIFVDDFTLDGRMPQVISSSSYPVYEFDCLYDDDDKFIGDKPWIAIRKIQCRNNSGATKRFWIQLATRYILNRADQANEAS